MSSNTDSFLVECTVGTGFASHELYVKINGSSSLVHRDNISLDEEEPTERNNVPGKVSAYPLEVKEGKVLIGLPGEPAGGDSCIWVDRSKVSVS